MDGGRNAIIAYRPIRLAITKLKTILDVLLDLVHQPISWMSAWCSLDASNQGRCELQQQGNICFQMVKL